MDLLSFAAAVMSCTLTAVPLHALLRWQGRVRVSVELDSRSEPGGLDKPP